MMRMVVGSLFGRGGERIRTGDWLPRRTDQWPHRGRMTRLGEIFRERLAVDLDGNALLVLFGRDFCARGNRQKQGSDNGKNSNPVMIHRLSIKHDGTTNTTKFSCRVVMPLWFIPRQFPEQQMACGLHGA